MFDINHRLQAVHEVECLRCGVKAGEPCVGKAKVYPANVSHQIRFTTYKQKIGEAEWNRRHRYAPPPPKVTPSRIPLWD
jgi:hypothetical protein